MRRGRYSEVHRFFCIRCGNEGIPIPRRGGRLKATGHMKKLYCPYCKMEINHVELRTEADVMKFKEDFDTWYTMLRHYQLGDISKEEYDQWRYTFQGEMENVRKRLTEPPERTISSRR